MDEPMSPDQEPYAENMLRVRFTASRSEQIEVFIRLAGLGIGRYLPEGLLLVIGALALGASLSVAAFIVVAPVALRLLALASAARNEGRHEHIARFTSKGVTITTPLCVTRYPWARFAPRSETRNLYLWRTSAGSFLWLPKRIVSKEDGATLRRLSGTTSDRFRQPH